MNEQINKAIEALVSAVAKPGVNPDPDKALKFSQAALNLSHVKLNLLSAEIGTKTKGSGS